VLDGKCVDEAVGQCLGPIDDAVEVDPVSESARTRGRLLPGECHELGLTTDLEIFATTTVNWPLVLDRTRSLGKEFG
jgi:hypothetical protein